MRRLGFIPGAVATGVTLMYAAKQIEAVGKLFLKVEKMGFTDKIQKVLPRPHRPDRCRPLPAPPP